MPTTFNYAFSAPINPPNVTPTLTKPQVWAGLERKMRFAHEFVPVITSCEVLEDKDGVVTRVVKFEEGTGPGMDVAKEVVKGFKPAWVDFEQENGAHIRNVISETDAGLFMTYMFEIRYGKDLKGDEADTEYERMAKHAVDSSIDVMREMVKDGRVQ
ncbi:DUF1857-domain-containing protein [Pleomassaria siparia CBS 279.74]|uniref:DUF1857-domain-containing protein n=1 Tax=Pleomassaria siparia CBS 279.74 TaxID=1314801 RepID=A0A6G1K933_9PLEO|nr:DUF1857-domain-containing protein [Pleomassaria siparia CBS 279.74]